MPVVAQDMLDQYGPHDSKLSSLDSALKDAVQMVRVSDQRITYLRKMHALLLLKRCDICRFSQFPRTPCS
jgi:hypothetical protein